MGVENTGLATWLAASDDRPAKGTIRLGAHLCTDDVDLAWDFGRAELPGDVRGGDTVRLGIALRAPERPGTYRIEFDLVDEHLAWFEDLGSSVVTATLVVVPR